MKSHQHESFNCPGCQSNWIGSPIPEKDQHLYGATHFQRQIGIDGGMIGVYDGIVAHRCPDCGEDFPRNDSGWAMEMFESYKLYMKDR